MLCQPYLIIGDAEDCSSSSSDQALIVLVLFSLITH